MAMRMKEYKGRRTEGEEVVKCAGEDQEGCCHFSVRQWSANCFAGPLPSHIMDDVLPHQATDCNFQRAALTTSLPFLWISRCTTGRFVHSVSPGRDAHKTTLRLARYHRVPADARPRPSFSQSAKNQPDMR